MAIDEFHFWSVIVTCAAAGGSCDIFCAIYIKYNMYFSFFYLESLSDKAGNKDRCERFTAYSR